MAAPYLTPAAATSRLLSRFNVEGSGLSTALLSIASDEIDLKGPFLGDRYVPTQERAFPRSVVPVGEVADGSVPDAILDYVALRALQLSQEPEARVTSEGAGGVSVTYAEPKMSRIDALIQGALNALKRHKVKTGGIRSVSTVRG